MRNSRVVLRLKGLYPAHDSAKPVDLAVLASSMLVLLGGNDTVAPSLASMIAGRVRPAAGRILLINGDSLNVLDRRARGLIGFVPADFSSPDGMTVSGHLCLVAAAAGFTRKRSRELISELLEWCSLKEVTGEPVERLSNDAKFTLDFASAYIAVHRSGIMKLPRVIVLQGPVPMNVHPLLADLCGGGCTVVISVPGIEYVPRYAERIVLCNANGVSCTVRFPELVEACSQLLVIRVKFLPALPRTIIDSLPEARNIVAIEGGYKFHHTNIGAAVANLVHLARANSRKITGLEIRPPSTKEIINSFNAENDRGKVGLFCPEDLDT